MAKSVAVATAGKAELVEKTLELLGEGAKKKDAEVSVNAVLDAVLALVGEGKKVQLMGFGTFDIVEQKGGRELRDPKTGALTGKVSEDKNKVKFSAGAKLKDAVPQA